MSRWAKTIPFSPYHPKEKKASPAKQGEEEGAHHSSRGVRTGTRSPPAIHPQTSSGRAREPNQARSSRQAERKRKESKRDRGGGEQHAQAKQRRQGGGQEKENDCCAMLSRTEAQLSPEMHSIMLEDDILATKRTAPSSPVLGWHRKL